MGRLGDLLGGERLGVRLLLKAGSDRAEILFPQFLEEVDAAKEGNSRLGGYHAVILMRAERWRNHRAV